MGEGFLYSFVPIIFNNIIISTNSFIVRDAYRSNSFTVMKNSSSTICRVLLRIILSKTLLTVWRIKEWSIHLTKNNMSFAKSRKPLKLMLEAVFLECTRREHHWLRDLMWCVIYLRKEKYHCIYKSNIITAAAAVAPPPYMKAASSSWIIKP